MKHRLIMGGLLLVCACGLQAQIKLPTQKKQGGATATTTPPAVKGSPVTLPTKAVPARTEPSTTTQAASTPAETPATSASGAGAPRMATVQRPHPTDPTATTAHGRAKMIIPSAENIAKARAEAAAAKDEAVRVQLEEKVLALEERATMRAQAKTAATKARTKIKPDNDVYETAEHMPTYPGGVKALMDYIRENVDYPEDAYNEEIEGLVLIQFIVEKDGTASHFYIANDLYPSLEEEALRVVQSIPAWNPATNHGQKVRALYSVPVKFQIPDTIE